VSLSLRLEVNLGAEEELLKQSSRIASRACMRCTLDKSAIPDLERQLETRRRLVRADEFAIPETITKLWRQNCQNVSMGFGWRYCHVQKREPG
jgi:hypothetical protein